MMLRLAACLILLASSHGLCAQEISGIVLSRSGEPVQGATIMLKKADSSRVLRYALSDVKGYFRIIPASPDSGILVVRHISYLPRAILLDTVTRRSDMVIIMEAGKQELQEVVVKASMPVLVRNDTVVYRAEAFAGPGVRSVEDLLGRMQGFMVSPDGRITYNGRPVEKVMVDGDDLAGKGYQLLTRNLSAGYIDKVEVLTDFSSNRLLGQLRRQDGVGVNLRIRERFRDRVSGGAEAAFSGSRHRGNLNAISLAARRKWFAFGEANNTADDVLGNLGNIPEGEGFPEGSTEGIISPGRVPAPPLAERYIRNNRDAAGAVMASWKSGRHSRLRMLLGHSDQEVRNEGSSLASTRISDSSAWQVKNVQKEMNRSKTSFFKLTGHGDDSAGKVDEYFVDLRSEVPETVFSDLTSLDVTDSLWERMAGRRIILGTGWKATRAAGAGRLFQWNTECSFLHSQEEFSSGTSRYSAYFGSGKGFDRMTQGLDMSRLRIVTEASWLKGPRKGGWQYGLAAALEKTSMRTETLLSAGVEDSSYSGRGVLSTAGASFRMNRNRQIGKKAEFRLDASLGPRLAAKDERHFSFFGYEFSMQFIKRYSALRSFRAGLQSARETPDLSKAVPAPVLQGNASILEGLDLAGPRSSHGLQLSYVANNLRKQMNGSASLNLSLSPRSYTAATWLQPEYSVVRYRLQGGGMSLLFMAGLERFLASLRGKLGFSLVVNGSRSEFLLNGKASSGRNESLQGEAWWISGFRGGFGLEFRFRGGRYSSSLSGQEGRSVIRSNFSQKIHWKKEGFFISAIWTAVQLGSGDWFNGVDMFIRQQLGGSWTLQLKAMNLLGVKLAREQTILPYSSSRNEFAVVPRYLLFGLGFQMK